MLITLFEYWSYVSFFPVVRYLSSCKENLEDNLDYGSNFVFIIGIESGPEDLWGFRLSKSFFNARSRNINLGHRGEGSGSFVWHGSGGFLSEHRTELFVQYFCFVLGVVESVSLAAQWGNTRFSHVFNKGPTFLLFRFSFSVVIFFRIVNNVFDVLPVCLSHFVL